MNNLAYISNDQPFANKFTRQSMAQTESELLNLETPTGFSGEGTISVRQLLDLIGKLTEVFKEAKERDWDGENAEPISDATYYNATSILSVLPVNLPAPEILPDNDGYIEFEWYKDGRSFSLYITDTNLVLYAGFYGKDDRLSGRFNYDGGFPILAKNLAKDVYKKISQ